MYGMSENEPNRDSFEETLRAIADEVSQSLDHLMRQLDVSEFAQSFGVDPERARDLADGATEWLRSRMNDVGGGLDPRGQTPRPPSPPVNVDDLRGAAPHPLDLPTEEQGRALAALDSGRWTVEPGANALATHGEGPGPSDALGLVRELRARDWLSADGAVTVVGRHALERWLGSAARL